MGMLVLYHIYTALKIVPISIRLGSAGKIGLHIPLAAPNSSKSLLD
jgi:hypothetical protein